MHRDVTFILAFNMADLEHFCRMVMWMRMKETMFEVSPSMLVTRVRRDGYMRSVFELIKTSHFDIPDSDSFTVMAV